jgi:hypothetical protein
MWIATSNHCGPYADERENGTHRNTERPQLFFVSLHNHKERKGLHRNNPAGFFLLCAAVIFFIPHELAHFEPRRPEVDQ